MTTAATPSRLSGRTAIVTGATSGIGAAIATALAREGAHVAIHGRDAARAEAVQETIRQAGGSAEFVPADLRGAYAELRTFAEQATTALGGRVDILVNNAGIYQQRSQRSSPTTISTRCSPSTSEPRTYSSPPSPPPWSSAVTARS